MYVLVLCYSVLKMVGVMGKKPKGKHKKKKKVKHDYNSPVHKLKREYEWHIL